MTIPELIYSILLIVWIVGMMTVSYFIGAFVEWINRKRK